MLYIPLTIAAAALQVARNAAQRSLVDGAGPWGATLVRFLFGLPFAIALAAGAWLLTKGAAPTLSAGFFLACAAGAFGQIVATAALLVSMRRSSFALGAAFQQSGIPLAAVMGLALGDHLPPIAWLGLATATTGLVVLAWPRRGVHGGWGAAALGVVAGAGFALASNAYRAAAHGLEPNHAAFAALNTLVVVQAMQAGSLSLYLGLRDRRALTSVIASWRVSLGAGFFGALASAFWFTAFALAPAGPVRAVGVVEMPISALAGRRLFAERLTARQWIGGALAAIGVVMSALH